MTRSDLVVVEIPLSIKPSAFVDNSNTHLEENKDFGVQKFNSKEFVQKNCFRCLKIITSGISKYCTTRCASMAARSNRLAAEEEKGLLIAKKKSISVKASLSSLERTETPKTASSSPRRLISDGIRTSVRNRFYRIFIEHGWDCGQFLATEIEDCLFKTSQDVTIYKGRFRSLSFNLNDPNNDQLRAEVFNGTLVPEKLVLMSTEALANSQIAKERERMCKEAIQATILRADATVPSVDGGSILIKKTRKGEEIVERVGY